MIALMLMLLLGTSEYKHHSNTKRNVDNAPLFELNSSE
jgi:hypothetical protein